MVEGKISEKILKFSLPMIVGNIFQQAYNLVDTIIVGKYIGINALASVGASFAIVVFINSVIIGLSMGVEILLAQYFGAKDFNKYKKVITNSFSFILVFTLIIMTIFLIYIDKILFKFNIPENLIVDTRAYLKIIIYGLVFCFLYNWCNSIIKSLGNSKQPLYFLIISSFINIILDLMFVLKFNLGVRGVAFATIIAQSISALIAVIYVYKKMKPFNFEKEDFKIDKRTSKLVCKYSMLTSIQQSIMNFGILLVQGLVNSFGTTIMAAFAAGVKVDSFAYMPVQDFGNAFSNFVAQNLGAGKKERIKQGIKEVSKIITGFSCIVTVLILFFAENIIKIFVDSQEKTVIALGVEYVRTVAIFYILIGFLFMFYGLYRGLGKINISILLTIISLGTRVILANVLSKSILGATGIWISIPIGWIIADILAIILFRRVFLVNIENKVMLC